MFQSPHQEDKCFPCFMLVVLGVACVASCTFIKPGTDRVASDVSRDATSVQDPETVVQQVATEMWLTGTAGKDRVNFARQTGGKPFGFRRLLSPLADAYLKKPLYFVGAGETSPYEGTEETVFVVDRNTAIVLRNEKEAMAYLTNYFVTFNSEVDIAAYLGMLGPLLARRIAYRPTSQVEADITPQDWGLYIAKSQELWRADCAYEDGMGQVRKLSFSFSQGGDVRLLGSRTMVIGARLK